MIVAQNQMCLLKSQRILTTRITSAEHVHAPKPSQTFPKMASTISMGNEQMRTRYAACAVNLRGDSATLGPITPPNIYKSSALLLSNRRCPHMFFLRSNPHYVSCPSPGVLSHSHP